MSKQGILSTPRLAWFALFKYTVYVLLAVNLLLFLQEDWQTSRHIFSVGMKFGQVIEAFASTIDTAAWLVLLLMFELETQVISDQRLRAGLQWPLQLVRVVCYGFIIYSLYGYIMICASAYSYQPLGTQAVCDYASGEYSLLVATDKYTQITAENCAELSNGEQLFGRGQRNVLAQTGWLTKLRRIVWTDVVNASCWLLIVLILEIDVWLQLRDRLSGKVLQASTAVKGIAYLTLLGAAVHWGIEGELLDFWDAFLWIVAFVFIELNLFQWHAET